MASYKRILVALDPEAPAEALIRCGVELAQADQGTLYWFSCAHASSEELAAYASAQDAKRQLLGVARARLSGWMAQAREAGVAIELEVYWNDDWPQSAVHAAARRGADLLLCGLPKEDAANARLTARERTLLRRSPCPVLVVREGREWAGHTLLLAVDLGADDPAHARLNTAVVEHGKRLAEALGMQPVLVAATGRVLGTGAREALVSEAAQRFSLEPAQVRLGSGDALGVLSEAVDALNAPVVVLGTVARRGLAATVLGNTAEALLKGLKVDLLVVN